MDSTLLASAARIQMHKSLITYLESGDSDILSCFNTLSFIFIFSKWIRCFSTGEALMEKRATFMKDEGKSTLTERNENSFNEVFGELSQPFYVKS